MYVVDYAGSDGRLCNFCNLVIEKGFLRFCAMKETNYPDLKVPKWLHAKCFFTAETPGCFEQITGFPYLKPMDKDFIITIIGCGTKGKMAASERLGNYCFRPAGPASFESPHMAAYETSHNEHCTVHDKKVAAGTPQYSESDEAYGLDAAMSPTDNFTADSKAVFFGMKKLTCKENEENDIYHRKF